MWIQGDAGGALRSPRTGRLGQRDELMLDQKTSEGFWESVPKATQQRGLQEHPSNTPAVVSHGDLLQHSRDTPKQRCGRRLRKLGSPWHSQALPLSPIPKAALRSRAGERSGRLELDACPRRLCGWHQPAPSSGVFCTQ